MASFWNEETEAQLKKYFEGGLNPVDMYHEFEGLVSRAAIIGKLHRMDLVRPKSTVKEAKRQASKMAHGKRRKKCANLPPELRPLPCKIPPPPRGEIPKDGLCKYPERDGDPSLWCAKPTSGNSNPWCAECREKVFEEEKPNNARGKAA